MRRMKKAVLLVLLAVMVTSPVFAVAGTMFTYDIQTCLQNILQKMQDAEHYASTYKKWAEDLAQYKRQIEQMERYYEELKGVGESIKDASFLEAWNGTKRMLQTASNLTGTANQIVSKGEKNLSDSKLVLVDVQSKLDEMTFKEDEYNKTIENLTTAYYNEVRTEHLNIQAKRDAYNSGDSTRKRNWDANLRKAIQYEQEKIKIYSLAIKQSLNPLIEKEQETITEMQNTLSDLEKAKKDLKASRDELQKSYDTIVAKPTDKASDRSLTEIDIELRNITKQIQIIDEQMEHYDALIEEYSSKDSDSSIYKHQVNVATLNSRKTRFETQIASSESLITKYNTLMQDSV